MKKNNWNIKFSGQGMAAKSIINQILHNRGIEEKDIINFLNPSLCYVQPSEDLKNIHKAAGLVLHSRRPLVYADTDTDGCSAAAIMIRWFNQYLEAYFSHIPYVGAEYYINEGKDHGIQDYFFISNESIIDTIIIVDSINDDPKYYIDLLNKGKNVIVLDHHIVPEAIKQIDHPQFALVSSAWDYPNPALSGSGVVWKFCRYLDYLLGTDIADELTDLAACGIVADVCSVGLDSMENRAICNKAFNNPINSAILKLSKGTTFDSTLISLGIAPLVNAANRMNRNDLALSLFLEDNREKLDDIIKQLEQVKKEQKLIVEALLPDLIKQGESDKYSNCKIFFTEGNNTLTGLLATKLCEYFGKPTLVLHNCGDTYKGSMRAKGIEDFSVVINRSGVAEARGHENSAGVIINKNDFHFFKSYIEEELQYCSFVEGYEIDVELERPQITPFLMTEFKNINRITGANFKPIRVCIDNVKNYTVKEMSKGQHLSVNTSDLKFLYWNFKDWDKIIKDAHFSAIGSLQENNFMGRISNQLIMEDFNFSGKPDLFEINNNFIEGRVCLF